LAPIHNSLDFDEIIFSLANLPIGSCHHFPSSNVSEGCLPTLTKQLLLLTILSVRIGLAPDGLPIVGKHLFLLPDISESALF